MNKILNWLFGACFRTLGRFLAIFLILALFLFIGSKLDIELPDWLSLRVNASEFKAVNTNFYNIFNGSSNVSISEDTSLSYRTTNNFESTNYYNLSLPSTKYLSIPSNSNYIYFQTYTKFWNGENSNVLNFNYNFNVGVYFNTQNVTTCTQLSNSSEHNVGYITWKCPIPSHATDIRRISFFGFNQQLDSILDGTSGFTYGVYNWFILFEVPESASIIENQEQTNDKLDDINQTQNDIKDSINNNDTTGAESSASGFFDNFSTETFGLTSIITAPLNAINSIINSRCNNLVLPLPFVNKNLTLPCMNSIYSNYFEGFFDLYQIITTGLISYYIIVRIFNLVKDFKNPDHDEIEVMDL